MVKVGKARLRLNGNDRTILAVGDGAFVRSVDEGDDLAFECFND